MTREQILRQAYADGFAEALEKAAEGIVYHASPRRLRALKPSRDHGDTGVVEGDGNVVFGTPYKQMALAYLGRWGDRDINQGYRGRDNWYLREMRPDAFKDAYGDTGGWLYELPADKFKRPRRSRGGSVEVVSEDSVKPIRSRRIKDVLLALADAGVELHDYNPEEPDHGKAVEHMRMRLAGMGPEDAESYLRWVGETNPELARELDVKSK